MADDRYLTMQEIAVDVNKKMGAGTMLLGSDVVVDNMYLPTGVLAFDLAFGGGWPVDHWAEVVATPTFGKTALAFKTVAHNQDKDPDFTCLFIAAEPFVKKHAVSIGVDVDRLWLMESNEMEPVFNLIIKAVSNRAVDMVVLDSLPALVTAAELDKDMDEVAMGSAKIISTFFKKMRKAQRRSLTEPDRHCTMLCLNSWRDAIGVKYGDPRVAPGGKAKDQEFFLRVELTRDEWIAEGSKLENRVGQVIKARTFKNKTGPSQRIAQVDFYFDDTKGGFRAGEFDTIKDIVNVSIALDVIKRGGATYSFEEYRWRGKDCAKIIIPQEVREDLDLQRALIAACHKAYLTRGEVFDDPDPIVVDEDE